MKAYESVLKARAMGRPTFKDYINNIFDGFLELHGDRLYGDDRAVICGLAKLCGTCVTVIGTEKGGSTKEKIAHNFGSPYPEGYRKALRIMKQAEKFSRPIICFVDTAGAYCGIGAEERGQGSAIAANLMEMMTLRTPIISIVIGEGGSGGALALAVANEVWMLENAYYSVISPEGAASIIWKDSRQVEAACEALKLTSAALKEFGVIEEIISETDSTPDAIYKQTKEMLVEKLALYNNMSEKELLEARYEKFRRIGRIEE